MGLALKGIQQMRTVLQREMTNFPGRVEAALYREAQIEMTEAKKRCPVSPVGSGKGVVPGALRASGTVHPPERNGNGISITLSFGGAAIDYALAVHEHLSEHSPPSWVAAEASGRGIHWNVPGTGPKFLESTLNESAPYMAERVARRLFMGKK